jgi:light-regulated signal transduction histidine kinase (bacteriophytochrome)
MGQLLNDIVAYSRAGREDKTRMEPTQSVNVLQWAIMNVDGLAKQTGAVITWDPLPTVVADQAQLATVFQHLLTNGMKFRSGEPPNIHISAQQTQDRMWEFSIRDNGVGVDPEYLERVFGVFKRLASRDVPGTGIGLAICRKIIEAHGGQIWMESQAGQGATVKFTLPAHE